MPAAGKLDSDAVTARWRIREVALVNTTDYSLKRRLREAPETLDADMTAADIIDALKSMKFEDQFRLIEVDAAIRDFLVRAVTALWRK